MIDIIKKNWLIILIILISAFCRLYRIQDYMEFLGDQGRDVVIVRDFLKNGNLFFIGPQTSIGNMYLGPYYYYFFVAPGLLLANFNPVGPAIVVALLGILTVYLLFRFTKKWFNPAAGYISPFRTLSLLNLYRYPSCTLPGPLFKSPIGPISPSSTHLGPSLYPCCTPLSPDGCPCSTPRLPQVCVMEGDKVLVELSAGAQSPYDLRPVQVRLGPVGPPGRTFGGPFVVSHPGTLTPTHPHPRPALPLQVRRGPAWTYQCPAHIQAY